MKLGILAFWDVTLCSGVNKSRRFEGYSVYVITVYVSVCDISYIALPLRLKFTTWVDASSKPTVICYMVYPKS